MPTTPFSPQPEPATGISGKTVGIAAGAVLLILLIVAVATLRRPATNPGAELPSAPYAAQLPVSAITLSEATNGGGGKATYVDGTLTNTGQQTVTAASAQVTFATQDGSPPHRETVPLTLIRTRVPYVDLEPVSAEPLKPGDTHDFRLIFESVPAAWDTQPPTIRLVHLTTR